MYLPCSANQPDKTYAKGNYGGTIICPSLTHHVVSFHTVTVVGFQLTHVEYKIMVVNTSNGRSKYLCTINIRAVGYEDQYR